MKEQTKNITLRVKLKLYNQYRNLCKQKGWIVSRQFELLMEQQIETQRRKNNEKLRG